MKNVKLVTFKVEQIVVDDMRNTLEHHRFDRQPDVIANSSEYVPSFVEVETSNIELVVDKGVKHYMSVSDKVWEYIYLMKNPITAKTQQRKIDDLKDYKSKAMVTIEQQAMRYKRLVESDFWTRVKWLFTGVK